VPKLTAIILTHNESLDIAACIESCRFCDHVIVFDSNSSDDTRERAAAAGADVRVRAFTNYAEQRNAALQAVDDASWVLMIDADERVPPDLAAEVRAIADQEDDETAVYRIRRKDFFFGRWMRRATAYPTWFARLLRPAKVRFVRDINEDIETNGRVGFLQSHFHHFPFSKGVTAWVDRHNRYSTLEARRLLAERQEPLSSQFADLFDPAKRRRLAKQLFYRLPCRPLLAFVGLYFIRGGVWDGWPGLQYCRLRAVYEYMIYLKMRELQGTTPRSARSPR
jgi:glycosyltransferase involved in cell wall biosynthesis